MSDVLYKLAMNLQKKKRLDVKDSPFGKLNPSFDDVVEGLKNNKFKNIVVACGAGISVSAGIPDFRSPGTGLYYNLQKYNLPYAEAIFDINYFIKNPRPFFRLAQELWPQEDGIYKPTRAHKFIKKLNDKGLLLRCFSQNIDGLEQLAGIPDEKVVAAHGNFYNVSCVKYCLKKKKNQEDDEDEEQEAKESAKYVGCGKRLSAEEYKEFEKKVLNPQKIMIEKKYYLDENGEKKAIGAEDEESIKQKRDIVIEKEEDFDFPRCPHCGGLAKPEITFFGEQLPRKFFDCLPDIQKCDLLLVIGTSLQVVPFSTVVDMTKIDTPRVLINREAVGPFKSVDRSTNLTDVLFLGDIDRSIKILERELGWETEDEKKEEIPPQVVSKEVSPKEDEEEEEEEPEIDMDFFEELKEMGYDEALIKKALIETDNISVAHAVNWIIENE